MERIKYPRTYHLPYSQSKTDDDKTLPNDDQFKGMEVVVTIKMDGENTTVYPDGYIHARSLDGTGYEWQNWLKAKVWDFCYKLEEDERIIGENLYAKHSIGYKFDNIEDSFQVFCIAAKDDKDSWIYSWDSIKTCCKLLGLKTVKEIYRGIYDKDKIMGAFEAVKKELAEHGQDIEGFVVRDVDSFDLNEFSKHVAKYVRANHVQTDKHWRETWTKNEF